MLSHARTPGRLTRSLITGLLLVAVTGGAALAQGAGSSGSTGSGVQPITNDPPITIDDGAIPAFPDPTVTGAQEVPWDHIKVGPDGRTLTVFFWNGAEGCYGLKDVQVTIVGGLPVVKVFTGLQDDAALRLCIEIAQLYKTDVVLDAPILGGGVA
jgi:hypothetical protein